MYIHDRKLSGPVTQPIERPAAPAPAQPYPPGKPLPSTKPARPAATLRVGSYWTNDFSKGACRADDRLKYSDDLAQGFAKGMARAGHKWAVNHGSYAASAADWLSYADATGTTSDNSEAVQGADTVHFAYLVTHGGLTYVDKRDPTPDLFVYRAGFGKDAASAPAAAFKVESSSTDKWPRCIWFNNKSRLGDKSLIWLVVDACESLQLPGYDKSHQMNLDVNPAKMWHHAFHGLNMVFGFTGTSTDSWWIGDRGFDFGRRAGKGDKLESAWTDEAYSYWTGDSPVALACGRNEADAANRLRFDRATAPFASIPHDQIGGYAWMWRS